MAFVVTALLVPARLGGIHQRLQTSRGPRVAARRVRWQASATPGETGGEDTPTPYSPPEVGLDTDALMEKASSFADDVGSRPGYYGKLAAYGLGAVVALTILNAVVGAIDAIPVLPSALELVGLGYTSWFIWRYVIFKESREELMEEIEDLMGRARPPSSE